MTSGILYPRQAAQFIADRSKDVHISVDGVKDTACKILKLYNSSPDCLELDRWKAHTLNPKTEDENALNWIFVSDLLNFSFWSPDGENRYTVNYAGQAWTGYWSLCAAMNRAIDEGYPITDPAWYGSVTMDTLSHVFRSDSASVMPLLDDRLTSLHMAAKVLLQKYDGRFANVVSSCSNSAVALYKRVVEEFETFRDEAEYEGQRVALYKRAQILVGDIWACFKNTGYGEFHDIDELTAFADYRIPQALVWFGVLHYSDNLMERLRKDELFESGERQEVEIRGCTLWAIELIVQEMNSTLRFEPELPQTDSEQKTVRRPINAIVLDHFMWDYRRDHETETNDVPYHKIRCIYY